MLTHFSLFTGIGGIDLAAEWAGFETVGQCEFADYATKVLEKHWLGVPRWRDVRDVTTESIYERTGYRPESITVISGGFPCQPFSVAGKQKGKGDDRYLWPEMLRVVGELKPRWVIGENVPGILSIAADDVCKDLEREGYEVGIFDYEAAAIGAKHRRERIFFVANATRNRWDKIRLGESTLASKNICNSTSKGFQKGFNKQMEQSESFKESKRSNWWSTEPELGRVANGIPKRVDRLKCLGNAVVPQQVYPILKAIADIEIGIV